MEILALAAFGGMLVIWFILPAYYAERWHRRDNKRSKKMKISGLGLRKIWDKIVVRSKNVDK